MYTTFLNELFSVLSQSASDAGNCWPFCFGKLLTASAFCTGMALWNVFAAMASWEMAPELPAK